MLEYVWDAVVSRGRVLLERRRVKMIKVSPNSTRLGDAMLCRISVGRNV